MAERPRDWDAIRTGSWAAAAGLVAGAILCSQISHNGPALTLAAAALLAGGAIFAGRRAHAIATLRMAMRTQPDPELLPDVAREVFEQLPDPMMLIDGNGRAVFANQAMRAIVGTDVMQKPVSALLRMPAVLAAVERTIATGAPAAVEFTLPVPLERYYQTYAVRTNGEPRFIALLFHDMTTVRRAEQARADFVANASHELRTPLAAVSGFIDTLRGHAKEDPAARNKFLDIMSVEAGRMRRLIDDLLSLNRIELNEHVPPSGTVDLAGLVKDAVAALGPLAESDDITVTIAGDANLPEVAGTRDELIQLFQNLIHNAIKYGKTGGHVWITQGTAPTRRGQAVFVSIRDDGEGIAREAIPRLTERFYRVDVKRSREKGGTGLGLAIVKHIVSRHKGRLTIESAPGEGSLFTVILPAFGTPAVLAGDAVMEVL
ncbi:MAG TPA: ATP-binding protein [Rhizomicrobium sp.]|nr:ATP-binding protein [Rhizomicrobium sp.]